MKSIKKQSKTDYKRFLKVIKEAEKEAEKFIRANSKIDPQLQARYR